MQFHRWKRREFITLLGGAAAAWPLAARAQSAMPTIGFLYSQSSDGSTEPLRGFRQGLKDAGFVEGENLTIDYRWAENNINQLPALAEELVRRRVMLIAAMDSPSALLANLASLQTIKKHPLTLCQGDRIAVGEDQVST